VFSELRYQLDYALLLTRCFSAVAELLALFRYSCPTPMYTVLTTAACGVTLTDEMAMMSIWLIGYNS